MFVQRWTSDEIMEHFTPSDYTPRCFKTRIISREKCNQVKLFYGFLCVRETLEKCNLQEIYDFSRVGEDFGSKNWISFGLSGSWVGTGVWKSTFLLVGKA